MSRLYYEPGPAHPGKVFLATICYDNPDTGYVNAIQASRLALKEAGIESEYLILTGNCHVDDARNTAVAEFLLSDCESLVFLDADVSWRPGDLVKLCRFDLDFVGGVYPYRRQDKAGEMPLRWKEGGEETFETLEVEGLPAGFLKVRRHVLETLVKDAESYPHNGKMVPLLFQRTLIDGTRWGGDLHVCNLWRAKGGKIYAALEIRLGHAAKVVLTDSLGAYRRRQYGSTLAYVVGRVRAGKDNAGHYDEAYALLNDAWVADAAGLQIAVAMARKAKGPILEIGSGLSTVLMAAATEQTVYCLEHSGAYANRTADMARQGGVQNIGICVAPLKDGWYDPAEFDGLPDAFDVAFVDGPPRQLGDRMKFFEHFDAKAILADDADDPAYADRLRAWAVRNGRDIVFPAKRTALIRKRMKDVRAA